MRIAIVGSGIAGLSAAWILSRRHDVVLLEKEDRLGGHSNTLTIGQGAERIDVDTGFIVYNERCYPHLVRLLRALAVETEPSCMSFSASLDGGRFEYSGASPAALIAQKRNVLRPAFARMLLDIARFNRLGGAHLATCDQDRSTLGAFLEQHHFGERFRSAYLLPMAAAIWSAPLDAILEFPTTSFLRFFDNHGLLTVNDQPQWRTLTRRSRDYVQRIASELRGRVRTGFAVARVERQRGVVGLTSTKGEQVIADRAVLACHADQSLAMLADADANERQTLEAFRFQSNVAILHSDPALMPRRRAAWAAWNYVTEREPQPDRPVSVTYWMNRLQNIDHATPLFVSLNAVREPRPDLVHRTMTYEHPVLDGRALEAQARIGEIQGRGGIWYAGAWLGYGFHEDGLRSAIAVSEAMGVAPPWDATASGGAAAGLPDLAAAQSA